MEANDGIVSEVEGTNEFDLPMSILFSIALETKEFELHLWWAMTHKAKTLQGTPKGVILQ